MLGKLGKAASHLDSVKYEMSYSLSQQGYDTQYPFALSPQFMWFLYDLNYQTISSR